MTRYCLLLSTSLALCTVASAQWVEAVVPTGHLPGQMCWQPAVNKVYVANIGDSVLTVIDGRTNEVLDPVLVGPAPELLAMNATSGRLFVCFLNAREFVAVDCFGDTVVARHVLTDRPRLLVSAPEFDRVFCIGDSLLFVFDATGENLRARFRHQGALQQVPTAATLAPDRGKLYIFGDLVAVVVDVAGDSVLPRIELPGRRYVLSACYSPGAGRVFAGVNHNNVGVYVIDAAADTVIREITQVTDVIAMDYNSTVETVYFASRHNWVFRLDPMTLTVLRVVHHWEESDDLTLLLNPMTNRGFVSYVDLDSVDVSWVVVFDCLTNLELARFPVLDWAYQGCINEADGRVYFSSPPLDSVVIIRDSLLTGVNEPRGAQRRSVGRGPTVVRGSLSLTDLGHDPGSENRSGSCPAFLLDATGRKVMELQPGDNDVRHLAPGVYFVRTALWERSPDRDFVRKVAIQR